MTSLKYLNLGHNQLQGQPNDMFGQLSALSTLDLSFNSLTRQLPESFSSLSNMTNLYLHSNKFTGTIDVLANLPLEHLNIENNYFSGWIPDQLKNIDLRKDGNSWSSGPAPPPPASNDKRIHGSGSNNNPSDGGSSKKSVGMATLVTCASLVFWFRKKTILYKSMLYWRKSTLAADNVEAFFQTNGSLAPKRYTYSSIKKVTNSFQDKLGQEAMAVCIKASFLMDVLLQ